MTHFNILTIEKYSKKFLLFQRETEKILSKLQKQISKINESSNSPKEKIKTQLNEIEKELKNLHIQNFIPIKKQEKFFAHIITPKNKIIKFNPSENGILYIQNQNLNGILISNAVKIYCDNNQIKKLILPNATDVSCTNNQIEKIEYFDTPKAERIFCNNNKITEINAPKSKYIMCYNNKIKKYNTNKKCLIHSKNNPITYEEFKLIKQNKPQKIAQKKEKIKMDTLKNLTKKILIIEIEKFKQKNIYTYSYQNAIPQILKSYYTQKSIYKNQNQILEAIKKYFNEIQHLKNQGYAIQTDILFENPKLFFTNCIKEQAIQIINHSCFRKKSIPNNTLTINNHFIEHFTQEILKV